MGVKEQAEPGKYYETDTEVELGGKELTIPGGASISKIPGEYESIDNGLVIYITNKQLADEEWQDTETMQTTYNQFVWIPVETPVSDIETDGTKNKAMAVKKGENYIGLIYDFTDSVPSTSTVRKDCTTTETDYREPAYLTNISLGDNSTANEDIEKNKIVTEKSLQQEYNKMITSVIKYKGFYVGRYELGLDINNNPTSKKATEEKEIRTANANEEVTNKWYGLYLKCKEFAPEGSENSVISSMIWGSQYDAMMNWMAKQGEAVGTKSDIDKINTSQETGNNENDCIRNIFDIYGCHWEWTLEAKGTLGRSGRGGYYDSNDEPSYRGYGSPTDSNVARSSRLTLYIK